MVIEPRFLANKNLAIDEKVENGRMWMTCAGMMLAEAPSTTIHQAITHISIEWRKMNSAINEIDKFATKTVNESHTIQPGSPLFILFRLFASIPVLFCCLFFGFLYLATLFDFSFCALNNFEAHQTTLLRKNHLNKRSSLSDHWHPLSMIQNSRGVLFTFHRDKNKSYWPVSRRVTQKC